MMDRDDRRNGRVAATLLFQATASAAGPKGTRKQNGLSYQNRPGNMPREVSR